MMHGTVWQRLFIEFSQKCVSLHVSIRRPPPLVLQLPNVAKFSTRTGRGGGGGDYAGAAGSALPHQRQA